MKIADRVNRRFSVEAKVERVIHKKFAVEAKKELAFFVVVGLTWLDKVTWVTGLGTRVDWVEDRFDIQIGIILDWMWDTIVCQ